MKTLLLIRHAKSSWKSEGLSDFERPLNERGKYDAPIMAHRIKNRGLQIDAFISSPAKRARKTAKIFMQYFDVNEKEIVLIHSLYEASLNAFKNAVESIKNEYNTVAIFAHNPAITEFANSLDCFPVFDMPTCSIYAVKIHSESWSDLQLAEKEFLFFDYPKNED